MSCRKTLFAIALLCTACPAESRAVEIEFSNPYYRVFNGITESRIDEDFATFAVFESLDNATGDLSLASDIGYATAAGYSDGLFMSASSSADGSGIATLELDSVSSEGNARFETDFYVPSGTDAERLLISYSFALDLVSSDPQTGGFGSPGTRAASNTRDITIFDDAGDLIFGALLQPGDHSLLTPIESEALYRLKISFNAVAGVKESTGFASADASLGFSITAVPEPGTGVLASMGLIALGYARSRKRS